MNNELAIGFYVINKFIIPKIPHNNRQDPFTKVGEFLIHPLEWQRACSSYMPPIHCAIDGSMMERQCRNVKALFWNKAKFGRLRSHNYVCSNCPHFKCCRPVYDPLIVKCKFTSPRQCLGSLWVLLKDRLCGSWGVVTG